MMSFTNGLATLILKMYSKFDCINKNWNAIILHLCRQDCLIFFFNSKSKTGELIEFRNFLEIQKVNINLCYIEGFVL